MQEKFLFSKLKSLVPYLAGLAGNLIKYSKISNDLGQEDKLIKAYIEIFELMLIIKIVPAYLKNKAKRQAITMPKIQMIDLHLLGAGQRNVRLGRSGRTIAVNKNIHWSTGERNTCANAVGKNTIGRNGAY
ncbi:DUF4143 domain-containing protein [Legionella cincinnatiensis]|uniref:DUF4143 domain-containing protein n=1 Tax=Legionella cincinnatiensis TaxID=28085 RepID=A0A378IL21_9GAMM|nr:hypothetical protein [Legionella cincinnatiensis]KTC83099.1 hypothetical protein Lcin_2471 [Legionella cincinnatiensis]STX35859.1 Uncharacterised protein [Legionella cincinnatiensis]